MPTDTERREVARRLRSFVTDNSVNATVDVSHILYVLGLHYVDVDRIYFCGYDVARLADLIEPDEPKVKCVAEVKVDGERLERLVHDAAVELTGIDRDALLEEVKELERCAGYFGLDFDEDEPLRDRLEEASEAFAESARCIREALGVPDERTTDATAC